jgi:hypothetical protein
LGNAVFPRGMALVSKYRIRAPNLAHVNHS